MNFFNGLFSNLGVSTGNGVIKSMNEQSDLLIKRSVLEASVFSNVGLKRPNNEDNFLVNQICNKRSEANIHYTSMNIVKDNELAFFGVFDGMGGGENGEIASLFTAQEVCHELINYIPSSIEIDCAVQKSLLLANNKIVDEQTKRPVCGTTATVLCIFENKFKIYHLGDTRAYLLRDQDMFQLTKDQTLAEMKLSLGFYEKDDPLIEKEKHQLTEYVGCDFSKEGLKPVESEWLELQNADRILLCSDGLYDMCPDYMIREVLLKNNQVEGAARELVEVALKNGGSDNVTCLVMEYQKKDTI